MQPLQNIEFSSSPEQNETKVSIKESSTTEEFNNIYNLWHDILLCAGTLFSLESSKRTI